MGCNNDKNNIRELLDVTNVCITLNNIKLVSNISFKVNTGEILAVVGPNGAGKTSLFKAISSDMNITDGQIHFMRKPISEWGLQEIARHMSILPQLSLLNFPYTVEEVIGLSRISHCTGTEVDKTIIQEAMASMDMLPMAQRLYTELSGGEKQRTQLARVMAQIWREEDASGRLMLLDEPTTALDLGHQQQLMKALKQFSKQSTAIIMIVHDFNLALQYADKILVLKAGKSLAQGTPNTVVTENLLEELFETKVKIIRDSETENVLVIS